MARTGNIILTQMNNLSLESFEKKKSKTLEIWPVPKTYMLKLKIVFNRLQKNYLVFKNVLLHAKSRQFNCHVMQL